VAELYIVEKRQRQGLGKCFLDLLIQWGLDQGASALVVEVDRDLSQANLFWNSFEFQRFEHRKRSVYVFSQMRRLTQP
jgi:GNAT superfamily N-acetyltransferase